MITMGRPKKPIDSRFLELMYSDYVCMTGKQVAEKYGVSLSTVRRYVKRYREQLEEGTHEGHDTVD